MDLTGQVFERLTVIGPVKNEWFSICSCGNLKITNTYNLLNGRVKSCGCLLKEQISKNLKLGSVPQTFCKRGHEFSEANTYQKRDGRRRCRACSRQMKSYSAFRSRLHVRIERKREMISKLERELNVKEI